MQSHTLSKHPLFFYLYYALPPAIQFHLPNTSSFNICATVISFYHGKHGHPHYLTQITANQLPILTHRLRRHQLMHGSCCNHKFKFNHIPFLPKGKEKEKKKSQQGYSTREICWSGKRLYMQNGCGDREPKFVRNDSESYKNVPHFSHISHSTISATHTHYSGFVDVYKINSTFSHRINTAQNLLFCVHVQS